MYTEVTAITTDSRKVEKRESVCAHCGERVDAHKFIRRSWRRERWQHSHSGAAGSGLSYIVVESSLQAVKDIAEFYLEQLSIPWWELREAWERPARRRVIASVLKEKYNTLYTEGNFNNELGLPLTVFRLRREHEIAVLEMGISDFGEMSRLAKIARPDTCVITNIGTCHLENLGDRTAC